VTSEALHIDMLDGRRQGLASHGISFALLSTEMRMRTTPLLLLLVAFWAVNGDATLLAQTNPRLIIDRGDEETNQPAGLTEPGTPATATHPVRDFARDVAGDFRHLPSYETLGWLLLGGTVSAAALPVDDRINGSLSSADWMGPAFEPGKIIGYGFVQIGAAALTSTVGQLRHEPRLVHLGRDLLRAQIVAQTMTYGLKYTVRRERPTESSPSFPSGHATVAFTSAAVLERHLGWKAAVPAYAVATYVAASRLHENRHFLSDVAFGAAVGIVAGRTVTRHGRAGWSILPVPTRRGFAVVVTRQ
jgi:membrane-associated phospholipid phosphatase